MLQPLYMRSRSFRVCRKGRRRRRGYASSSSISRHDQRGCKSLLVSSPSKSWKRHGLASAKFDGGGSCPSIGSVTVTTIKSQSSSSLPHHLFMLVCVPLLPASQVRL